MNFYYHHPQLSLTFLCKQLSCSLKEEKKNLVHMVLIQEHNLIFKFNRDLLDAIP